MAKNLEDLKINPEILKNNGYRSFKDARQSSNPWYMSSYQKRYDDEHGKMFFINFTFNDRHKASFSKDFPETGRFGWEADLQLNTLNDMTMNISIFSSDEKSLEEVENFCLSLFRKMNFEYYEYGWSGLDKITHTKIAEASLTKEVIQEEKNFLEEELARLEGKNVVDLRNEIGVKPVKI